MIKKLTELSDKKIKSFFSEEVTIYEKLDMVYFKVNINTVGVFPLKTPKFNAVTDIDCICNSIYADIQNFSQEVLYPIKNEIISKYGNTTVGFFYLPVQKCKCINYYTLDNGTFILSDIFTDDKSNKVSPEEFYSILPKSILPTPFISSVNISNENLSKDNIESVILSNLQSSFSGLPLSEVEGFIIKSKNSQIQIIINNTEVSINKSTKKIYRDLIMHSLASILNDEILEDIKTDKSEYIYKIAKLFKLFIQTTDIFSKYSFDEEDLLPPHEGFFGNLDVSKFKDDEITTICMLSKVSKNILRMLLHTFTNPISLNKFSDLSIEDVDKLNKLTNALKYKNFAEIALHSIK